MQTLELTLISLRTLTAIAAIATLGLSGCAQMPVGSTAQAATPTAAPAMPMGGQDVAKARMDEHMKSMRVMHDKMMQAKTPQERNALMAEHMKLMQDGMAMMGGMPPGGMMGKPGMGAMEGMKDKPPMAGDMGMHHQMMEKRMEMMQSMMQMMMDRMPPAAAR
jgi:hypothetical protein